MTSASLANPTTLPAPNALQLAHSDNLQTKLKQRMQQAGGCLSFQDYMQTVLYEPGLGYYSAGSQKFGRDGDFVTAPEMSPLFAACLARQCQQVLSTLETPVILEFGAGSGRLAVELLQHLQVVNALPEQYWILEVSADLRERQQQLLQQAMPDYIQHIQWLTQLPTQGFQGMVIANEVLDAMPVEIFVYQQQQLWQVMVKTEGQQFVEQLQAMPAGELQQQAQTIVTHLQQHDKHLDYYRSEINLWLQPWLNSLYQVLQKGVVLLIDYGFVAQEYYHPDRHMGTLMCHYRHHAHHDPYTYVGLQDITAHVDFSAVAKAAVKQGFKLAGFTQQASFLINCSLLDILKQYNIAENIQLNQQIQQLTSPAEMGELFKVMALDKDVKLDLLGFRQFDKRIRL